MQNHFIKNTVILIVSFFVGIFIFVSLFETLFPFLLGLIIAYIFDPIIKLMEKNPYIQIRRPYSILLIFSIFFIGIFYILIRFLVLFSHQEELLLFLSTIINNFENSVFYFKNYFDSFIENETYFVYIEKILNILTKEIEIFFQNLLTSSAHYILQFFNNIIIFTLTPIAVYYFLKDKYHLLKIINLQFPFLKEEPIRSFIKNVDLKIGSYIRVQFLLAFIVTIATAIFLFYFEKFRNYVLLFSIISGITNLIPYLGTIIGSVPIILAASYHYDFKSFIVIPIFLITLHGFIGFFLAPKLTSYQLKIHPLNIFITLAIGSNFGILGMLIAVPSMLILQQLIIAVFNDKIKKKLLKLYNFWSI